jgi:hypothetical protein
MSSKDCNVIKHSQEGNYENAVLHNFSHFVRLLYEIFFVEEGESLEKNNRVANTEGSNLVHGQVMERQADGRIDLNY